MYKIVDAIYKIRLQIENSSFFFGGGILKETFSGFLKNGEGSILEVLEMGQMQKKSCKIESKCVSKAENFI
jgi:hypothetical protein